jgi:hypothetical protein
VPIAPPLSTVLRASGLRRQGRDSVWPVFRARHHAASWSPLLYREHRKQAHGNGCEGSVAGILIE